MLNVLLLQLLTITLITRLRYLQRELTLKVRETTISTLKTLIASFEDFDLS